MRAPCCCWALEIWILWSVPSEEASWSTCAALCSKKGSPECWYLGRTFDRARAVWCKGGFEQKAWVRGLGCMNRRLWSLLQRSEIGSEKWFQVLSLDVSEDPEPSDLIDSTPEVHYSGRVDGSRSVSQKLEFLCDARQEGLTLSASRTGIPRDWFSGKNDSGNPHIWVRKTLLYYNSYQDSISFHSRNNWYWRSATGVLLYQCHDCWSTDKGTCWIKVFWVRRWDFAAHRVKFIGGFLKDFEKVKAMYTVKWARIFSEMK